MVNPVFYFTFALFSLEVFLYLGYYICMLSL